MAYDISGKGNYVSVTDVGGTFDHRGTVTYYGKNSDGQVYIQIVNTDDKARTYTGAYSDFFFNGLPVADAAAFLTSMEGVTAPVNSDTLLIAAGKDSQATSEYIHGRGPSGGSATGEEIWQLGGQYTWIAAPESLDISSSNAGDADFITITSLNASHVEQSTTTGLSGTTPVNVSGTHYRVQVAKTLGTTAPAGDVYVFLQGAAVTAGVPNNATDVRRVISAGDYRSHQPLTTVPAGYTGIVEGVFFNPNDLTTARTYEATLYVQRFGSPPERAAEFIYDSSAGTLNGPDLRSTPIAAPEKSDIWIELDFQTAATAGATFAGFNFKKLKD